MHPWPATPTSSTWYGRGRAAPSREHLPQGVVVPGGAGPPAQAHLTGKMGGGGGMGFMGQRLSHRSQQPMPLWHPAPHARADRLHLQFFSVGWGRGDV